MRRPPPSDIPDPDGLLLVDKPGGVTSHDVVDAVRRRFRFRKVGHGGTLDPMATGLLVLLIGRGTKVSDRVMGADKTYEGTLRLGVATDSEDGDGRVIAEADPSGVTADALRAAMEKRQGDQMQTPPMVSAIKKDGIPLYKLARRGETVEREARLVHIYEFTLLGFNPPQASFRMRCTKGTYVRTLCADIGREFGCGAFLESLRRTASGSFSLADARPLADILNGPREALSAALLPLTVLLPPAT
ncbi:MAG: tRNA pseudouridine(55) synthase TruB [Verrucomicrobia bacterium A1]|nr:MAG: tRNA pseudouridine(55) synthase TruB [Verrucomicrobia bacterium A1]